MTISRLNNDIFLLPDFALTNADIPPILRITILWRGIRISQERRYAKRLSRESRATQKEKVEPSDRRSRVSPHINMEKGE